MDQCRNGDFDLLYLLDLPHLTSTGDDQRLMPTWYVDCQDKTSPRQQIKYPRWCV